MSENMIVLPCEGCVHCVPKPGPGHARPSYEHAQCSHPDVVLRADPRHHLGEAEGAVTPFPCSFVRKLGNKCGRDAKLREPAAMEIVDEGD